MKAIIEIGGKQYSVTEGAEIFVEKLNNLEEIVKELEEGNVDLEDAINRYTEAMKIAKECSEKLDNATKAVNKILSETDELENFKEMEVQD